MALGEYVSVSSQRDSEKAQLATEKRELREDPELELAELALAPRVSQFLALSPRPWGAGDTPVTRGLWILGGEEDSIDRSFTVLVRVICRCLRAPSHRARWRVS